jgi:hypothetical protein
MAKLSREFSVFAESRYNVDIRESRINPAVTMSNRPENAIHKLHFIEQFEEFFGIRERGIPG